MILLDTNIVSEMMKATPNDSVASWAKEQAAPDLHVCVITVQEIEAGLHLLPAGKRREQLTRAWNRNMDYFADRLLVFDSESAQIAGRLQATSQLEGITMDELDAQIAAISIQKGCALATRNTKDFAHIPNLALVNPFAP